MSNMPAPPCKPSAAQFEFGWFRVSDARYLSVGVRDAHGRWYVDGTISMGIPDDVGDDAAGYAGDILSAVDSAGDDDPPTEDSAPATADGPFRAVPVGADRDLVGVCAAPSVIRTLQRTVADVGEWMRGFAERCRRFDHHQRMSGDANSRTSGPDFVPAFLLRTMGGRSEPIRVGRFRDAAGRWHSATEKTVEFQDGGSLCLIKTAGRSGVVRDLSSGETEVNGRPIPACDPLFNLTVCRDMGPEVRHVIRVLHFERRGDSLVIYSPWYRAGSLREAMDLGRFTAAERAGILRGPFDGLRWLHEEAGMLHYDIKPANVFVDRREGAWVGVLGDIDDAIPIAQCVAGGADIKSTPSYGAPQPHGDPRRDQVALLLTTVEALGGVDWYRLCTRALRDAHLTDRERTLWGYATDGTGVPRRWKRWVAGVYAQYAAAVRRGGPPAALAPLVDLVDRLESTTAEWADYDTVRTTADLTLRTIFSSVSAPQPPSTLPPIANENPKRTSADAPLHPVSTEPPRRRSRHPLTPLHCA